MERPDAAFYLSAFPIGIRRALEQKIQADETILWAGQPNAARILFGQTSSFLFGTAFVTVFLLSACSSFRRGGSISWGALLFAVLFALVSVGMMAAPFVAFHEARNTAYVITNKRAFSMTYSHGNDIPVIPVILRHPEELKSIARKDGSGTLHFFYNAGKRRPQEKWKDALHEGTVTYYPLTEFSDINNVHKVEELVRRIVLDRKNNNPVS